MSRLVASAFTALLLAAPSLAIAQMPPSTQAPLSEAKDLTDIRVDVVKNALQLSPEQMKYWPAIEEAIRSRAEARHQRLEKLATRVEEGPTFDRNFVQVLQDRATNLSERAAGLKKLADAWEPLYTTLTDAQKRRMRILGITVLHGVRERMAARRSEMYDQMYDDSWGAVTGPGSGESGRD